MVQEKNALFPFYNRIKKWCIGNSSKTTIFSHTTGWNVQHKHKSPLFRLISSLMVLCFLCATLLQTGCSTMQIPNYPLKKMEKYNHIITIENGLKVAIEPILDSEECSKYFVEDFLSVNILAVLISVENRSLSSSYIFRQNKISLFGDTPASESSELVDQIATFDAGRGVLRTSGILMIPGVIILPLLVVGSILSGSGINMISDVAETRHNFMISEFQTQTLSPGEETHGFVYFQLPDKNFQTGEGNIHFEVLNLSSRESIGFNIPFGWEEK